MSEQKQVSLSPDARRGHDKDACDAHAAQMISGQQGRIGERQVIIVGDGDRISGEDGRHGRAEHGDEGENGEDEIAAP